ncbi:hypothetical protein [Planomicrobium sp. CPCC 101079]|uniref:hypothetical protein n=1 Tax=Planomicrobium sp. CPCC 101079 TaxID=2599618 RepID=UPI0011B7684A|nr:hypothetical protein [Planomicrobium sp. CPCC 101079]TWT00558.1 hypothetical protein FQV28_17785 [Planomicrobium sp. CPCC 101079]
MEGLEIYFFIRFIFVFFISISLILMALTIRPFNRYGLINGFTIGLFVVVATAVSITNALTAGYLADGIYPGGDVVISYLFIILFFLCVLNVLLYARYFIKKENSSKRDSSDYS